MCVSVVIHGHESMLSALLEKLLGFPEVSRIIITFNIPSACEISSNERLVIINNPEPKGFGQNHNEAFKYCKQVCFCVLNPDVEFKSNPFTKLLLTMKNTDASVIATRVVNSSGVLKVNTREFPNIGLLFRKLLSNGRDHLAYPERGVIYPDWVAGLFMLLRSRDFESCDGFNEAYFLYYEDVDICTRLKKLNKKVVADMDTEIIHNAQRTSHKSLKFARWHLISMFRYLWTS